MRRAMLLVLCATGCGGFLPFPARTPNAIQATDKTLPHSVEYEMLAQTSGKACDTLEHLGLIRAPVSVDPAAVGHPALFEAAKFDAIVKIKGADGLVAVSAKAELGGGEECVTVNGRAYAIRAMRDGGEITMPERRAPRRDDDEAPQPKEGE